MKSKMKNELKSVYLYIINSLAHIKLKRDKEAKLIAVAGCYGKSSAVELISKVFSIDHKICTSFKDGKGLNSETGIPFTIFGIKPVHYRLKDWLLYLSAIFRNVFNKSDYDFYIFELGVDKPEDMKYLVSFYKPNIGILINSNVTHSANFEDLQKTTGRRFEDLIAYENGYVFEASKDAIIYNSGDPEVIRQVGRFKGKDKISYSENDPDIKNFDVALDGTAINFKYKNEVIKVKNQNIFLDEYKETFAMALKLADYYDINKVALVKAFSEFTPPAGRCSLFHGENNTYILDSSYNSSFIPTSSAMKLAKKLSNSKTIGILGDMRELGKLSEQEHKKLALVALKYLDTVITVGPDMIRYFKPTFQKNIGKNQLILSFKTTKEALNYVSSNKDTLLAKDDIILIKGSQNTLFLEIITEYLLKDKADVSRLCRRDDFYEEKRKDIIK